MNPFYPPTFEPRPVFAISCNEGKNLSWFEYDRGSESWGKRINVEVNCRGLSTPEVESVILQHQQEFQLMDWRSDRDEMGRDVAVGLFMLFLTGGLYASRWLKARFPL